MRHYANDTVRRLGSKKRVTLIMLFLVMCGGVVTATT